MKDLEYYNKHYFSVSDNKKIVFTKGNLQINKKDKNIWRITDNQYDILGYNPGWSDLLKFECSTECMTIIEC